MANEEKSFEDLLKEAPAAPGAGTISLIGTLARSSEPGKFLLTLQDGRTVTLETAAVKGHMVIGTSVGQTIVRIDVDASQIPASAFGGSAIPNIFTPPPVDFTLASRDVGKPFWEDKWPWTDKHPWLDFQAGSVTPFAMATPQQVSPASLAALQGPGYMTGSLDKFPWGDPPAWPKWPWEDNTGAQDFKRPARDGATGVPPYLD